MTCQIRYRRLDAAQWRASTHGDEVMPSWWPESAEQAGQGGEGSDDGEWCSWLREVWSVRAVATAVELASPSLAAEVSAVCAGSRPGTRRGRRLAIALARYLVRMRGRATPFGLFAGVGTVGFGDTVDCSESDQHSIRQRPDAAWWTDTVRNLESEPDVVERLMVVRNDLVVARGDRIVVAGSADSGEVSLHRSRAVELVLSITASPTEGRQVVDRLMAGFPGYGADVARGMVAELLGCGVLISCLRAPSTVVDPVRHLRDRLDLLGAPRSRMGDVPVDPVRFVPASTGSGVNGAGASTPWAIDLGLGKELALPTRVADEVEVAASVLARLVPWRSGHPGWRAYHDRFLDHFGAGAAVSVGELVDPVVGLGYPEHFAPGDATASAPTARDEALLVLAQQVALGGGTEAVLTDGDLDALDALPAAAGRAAPHLDVSVELRARSRQAVSDGDFRVVVVGVGRSGLATTGRFLDLLAPNEKTRAIEALRGLPASVAGAVPVQLSFTPDQPRVGNVARVTQVLSTVLSVGEYGPAAGATSADGRDVIGVRDLLVTADHDGLYLIDKNRGALVEPVVANAVARHAMAPMVRFLAELPRATGSVLSQFAWGVADVLPFRPRLRYGRCVLSAARWRIDPRTLPGPQSSREMWRDQFARLRERSGLPTVVTVGTGDRRLRLELDASMDLHLLRDHLDRAGAPITLAEASTQEDWGWIGGRAHEIVVPLVRDGDPDPGSTGVVSGRARVVLDRSLGTLPGSRLVSARVACAPEAIDTVLGAYLPTLLDEIGGGCPWWFVRSRAPRPQLRLRLPTDRYGEVVERLGRWVAELRDRGLAGDLVLDTYRPELARYTEYGDTCAMNAAEAAFAADSVAARVQVVLASRPTSTSADRHALTAASLFDLTCAVTGGRRAGAQWLIRRADLAKPAPALDRRALDRVQTLCSAGGPTAVFGDRDADALTQAWRSRARAVASYRQALASRTAARGVPPVPRDAIVVSLLHLHHVRACGPDPTREAALLKLARSTALTILAREQAVREQP